MALIAVITAALAAVGVWWWRLQMLKGAADHVLDAAGKARGMISRAQFRHRSQQAVLGGADSPGMAAATLLYSIAFQRRPLTSADEEKIDYLLKTICRMNQQDRDDAAAYAVWAVDRTRNADEVVRRCLPLWRNSLGEGQRRELVGMAMTVAELGGEPTAAQSATIRRLSEGLLPD